MVKNYADSMLSKGESREKIIRLLKEKGWKEDFINKIFNEQKGFYWLNFDF